MSDLRKLVVAIAATLVAAGCGTLEPKLPDAAPAVPGEWPLPPKVEGMAEAPALGPAGEGAVADVGWRDFLVDARLEEVVALALENNRDLRVAVLNVERSRELYRIQRADRVPSVDVAGSAVRRGGDGQASVETYAVDLGVTQFELDLFGRVRNLSEAALQRYLAEEEARRTTQLVLIAEVSRAWLTLAADRDRVRLSEATLRTREEGLELTRKRHEFGAVSALDVHQARTQAEAARADLARNVGFVAQDQNALRLLVGAPVDASLLPEGFSAEVTGLDALPAGLPSEVLLRRPDVLQAEYLLRAANADVGAARAAFFPSISLTGAVGTVSGELSGLFDSGTDAWSFTPVIRVPIFEAGRLQAQLGVAKVDREAALAQYERSIQAGFREAADALALTTTLASQRVALEATVDAAQRADQLSIARYEAGRDSYLVRLESQRTLYAAEQALIETRLAEQVNRVELFKVLGGGWQERSQ